MIAECDPSRKRPLRRPSVSRPFLFRRDPQVASGPIALAADMVTLLLYSNLGRWPLG